MTKRTGLGLLMIMLVLTFVACGTGNNNESEKENTTDRYTELVQQYIIIEDIAWNVDEGIMDGDRYVLLEYTNNSQYDIYGFELTFSEKAGISQEEKDKFYTEIQSQFSFSDLDMTDVKAKAITMHAESDRIIGAGETNKKVNCYYFSGSYYLKSMDHYSLVEPDIATIKYIDENQLKIEYYDFSSGKYSLDDDVEVADQWTDSELGTKIPKPDVKLIKSGRDDEQIYMFDAYGFSLEQFNAYVDECKKIGYTIDEGSFEGFYTADNVEGYNVYLNYNEEDDYMSGTVEKLED